MVDLKWPVPLSEVQLSQLECFRQLLVEWNERMNLTAITGEQEVYVKHFYDSLAVCQLDEWNARIGPGVRVIDIGTGAGFPGIPLAIALPDVLFVLCDALQKRVTFLQAVIDALGLTNVTCVHARSEDLARDILYRAKFDIVVSRAVARLNILMELMCPFLRVGGLGCSYKGPGFDDEREDGVRAAKRLNSSLRDAHTYTLPLSMGARTIVPFVQSGPIPKTYPRKAGVPQRHPL